MAFLWSYLSSLVSEPWPLRDFSGCRCQSKLSGEGLERSPFDEEQLYGYRSDDHYPIHIGQTFQSAKAEYQIVTKSTFDRVSTTWFARDLTNRRYVSFKLFVRVPVAGTRPQDEMEMYKKLENGPSNHPGRKYTASLFDAFVVEAFDEGGYQVLIHTPCFPMARCNDAVKCDGKRQTTSNFLKMIHDTAEYVGICDVKPVASNETFFKVDDLSACTIIENLEILNPSPCYSYEPADRWVFKCRDIGSLGLMGHSDVCWVPQSELHEP